MRAARAEHKMLCPANPPTAHKNCTGYEGAKGTPPLLPGLQPAAALPDNCGSGACRSASSAPNPPPRCYMTDSPAREVQRRSLLPFAALSLCASIASAQLPSDVPSLAPMIEKASPA